MLKNFMVVALRNFFRQKFYSFINVVGLSAGLACTLFIFIWVRDEVQKDKFHNEADTIFEIVSNLDMGDGELLTWRETPGPLAEDIRENIPEIEFAARTMDNGPQLFQNGEKSFLERGYFGDPDLFKIFSFPIISGQITNSGEDKSWVALSKQLATKLFGDDEPIGKTIRVGSTLDLTVVAVFDDLTPQSSIQFQFILPFAIYRQSRGDGFNWGNYDHPLYVKLTDPVKSGDAIAKINERRANLKTGDSDNVDFFIQPFTEYYLNSHYENGKPAGGRILYVQIFSVVAVFILIIACINFMNMATAKAATRAKEVGIRKVVGAQRISLIVQFMGESLLISFVSMIIAMVFVYLTLPMFNALVSKQIVLPMAEPAFLLAAIVIVMVTGLLAGSYPAFFLSSHKPASVLKGLGSSAWSGASLRQALVIFQFTLTVVLTASAMVVYNQITFIRNKNIGYTRESTVTFYLRDALFEKFESFRNEALQFEGIRQIAKANSSLVQVNNQNGSVEWPGKPADSQQFFRTVVADYGFLETMGLKLRQGRFFSRDFNDTNNFVLTQKSVEVMGLKDPIGTRISQWGFEGTVVGVVDDFHSRSMHEAIDPIVLMCKPEWTRRSFVRLDGTKLAEGIERLRSLHKKYLPAYPFEYSFLDDDFEKLYNNERIIGSLALGFTVMAVIISGLGLLGLAAYTAEKKRKEISIRKTLGASVALLIGKMSRAFVRLSVIATAIGSPLAYYLMTLFLSGYAYHTELGWTTFVMTAVAVIAISLVTVIYQVARAAVANPIDALRNE